MTFTERDYEAADTRIAAQNYAELEEGIQRDAMSAAQSHVRRLFASGYNSHKTGAYQTILPSEITKARAAAESSRLPGGTVLPRSNRHLPPAA